MSFKQTKKSTTTTKETEKEMTSLEPVWLLNGAGITIPDRIT